MCAKSSQQRPRKPFDSSKQRLLGTEFEQYNKKCKQSSTPQSNPRQKTLSWRQKHEEFIQSIRAAKQISDAIKSGMSLVIRQYCYRIKYHP